MFEPINKHQQAQHQKSPLTRTFSTKLIQTLNFQRLEKYVLAVQNHQLKKQIDLYEWRQKTDFPIVKVQSYKIIEQKLQKTHLQVIINSCNQTLTHLKQLKLQDVITLIKQAFIGFQRLFNKFKSFDVKPQMIIIDQKNKCRVWINSNFSLNQVQKQLKNFQTFFINIINIFETITLKTSISINFYSSLKNCFCFIKGLKFIQQFVKNNKLKLNSKPQFMKNISSTPNLIMQKFDQRLYPIEQESRNLRQTIGYLRKKQQVDNKDYKQAMTFAGKNTRPLQKRLQQMIRKLPNNQVFQNNNILLDKFKQKSQQNGDNFKKVFRSIKDFKFRKIKDQQKLILENNNNCQIYQQSIKESDKYMLLDKFRSQTARHDFEISHRKNFEFVGKNNTQTKSKNEFTFKNNAQVNSKNEFLLKNSTQTNSKTQQGGRYSIIQTRNTSFFNNSGERFCPRQNSTHSSKKFGNIKFSEISHNKNSEISDFNKDIENILFGIDGSEKGRQTMSKKDIFSQQNISRKSLHKGYAGSQHNTSILQQQELSNEQNNSKKPPLTKPPHHHTTQQPTNISSSAKYGAIDDDIQQPTAEQISQKYIQLGWKNTLNIFNFNEQGSQMKESIHAGDDHRFGSGNLLVDEKKPVLLGKLDRIRNKQLVQSVINQDFW